MAQLDYSPLFDAALTEPLGLRIETNNPKQMQVRLAAWRKTIGIRAYDSLEICCTEAEDEIFLIQKSVELD